MALILNYCMLIMGNKYVNLENFSALFLKWGYFYNILSAYKTLPN